MNPPAKQPEKKAVVLATVKKGAQRFADLLIFIAGMIAATILGATN